MPKRTTPFRDDLLADLADPCEAAMYLNAALEDSEEMFLVALRDVAEARQMAKVAETAGIARESIYRMLALKGNPTYSSLFGILRAVGLRLAIQPETPEEPLAHRLVRDKQSFAAGIFRQSQNTAGNGGEKGILPASFGTQRKDMASERSFAYFSEPAGAHL
jgi:probable addiction module antidote protein